jgi:hypothetical protein
LRSGEPTTRATPTAETRSSGRPDIVRSLAVRFRFR